MSLRRRYLGFSLGISLMIGSACGTSAPPAPKHPVPVTPAPVVDMADDYCHPCCLPSNPSCGLACEDCLEAACVSDPRAAAPRGCCTANRVPPDGGSLCPR